ncbi:MAG TPA: transposase [Candidatus Acidoferrum sp.]|jgi:putative transposase
MYHHKNIRLSPSNYQGKASYFVTLCCHDRQVTFSNPANCVHLLEILRATSASRSFAIHAYCIMPDHVHLLAEGLEPHSDLLNFLKTLKLKSSRAFSSHLNHPLWQKKYYDHILRPNESPDSVAWYIWLNPVRAGLATHPAEFPFAGSFTTTIPKTPLRPEPWTHPNFTALWPFSVV